MTQPDTRDIILTAARVAFCELGYRASMDEIARRAGVAKQTLYNHFENKQRLFGEVVRVAADEIMLTLNDGQTDLRRQLLAFAQALRSRLFSAEGLAFHRMVIAEADRFPAEARAVFDNGPGRAHATLTRTLAQAAARGEISAPSPEFAAEMFLSMIKGFEHVRILHGAAQPADGAPEAAERIVDAFLQAFGPRPR